ncbi:MAG: type II toxin-antitoxin system VapC family toxin [Candidatus Methanoperedens sp.]|nr:type II toxin-antitoxin system VapC family toxin [Candidatus Methanoperedens sp.]
MNIYIDSSAYVKEYHDETGSDQVHRIFENSKKGYDVILISLWTISETLNAIDKHFMRHELDEDEYNTVLGAIFSDMLDMVENKNLKIVDIDSNLVKMSWEYISSEHLSAADSLHLVTAIRSNADIFYAADKKLIRTASSKNLKAIDVEDI